MINTEHIINKWTEFTKFDQTRTKFNLGSWDYTFHKYNEKILKLTKEYDLPIFLTIIYIKNLFCWFTKECNIKIYDMLENPDNFHQIVELNNLFKDEEINKFEEKMYNLLNSISISLSKGKPLIGNMQLKELVENSLDVIFDELLKCNVEIYQKGEKVQNIDYICENIFIFNTLVEAISVLSNQPDGLYVCYIANNNTSDNYFGFFIKNNNNLFSINERQKEKFIGQHANGRNNRFLENKAFDLFPYELLEVKNRDYLGYAKDFLLKDDTKEVCLNDLHEKSYVNLLMTILLIKLRFENKMIEGDIVYSNFALSNNAKQITQNQEALIILNNNLIIKQQENKLNDIINQFTTENILSGELNKKYIPQNKELSYNEYGFFENNIFIDLYGKGFKFNPEVLAVDNTLKFLNTGDKNININAEFVGNEKVLSLQFYTEARRQLAEHIQNNMDKEYEKFENNFGSIRDWYSLVLNKYRTKIIRWVVQQYVDRISTEAKFINGNWYSCGESITIGYDETNYSSTYDVIYPFNKWNDPYCFINGKKTNCTITVKVSTYEDIETILGQEVPKIVKGWQRSRVLPNTLLDVVDPIMKITTPFEKNHYNFSFAIRFSRSGLKKYIKENNIIYMGEKKNSEQKDGGCSTCVEFF